MPIVKFIFLKDHSVTCTKYHIQRLGIKLAKELKIETKNSEIKWVKDFKFTDDLYYTGYLINSSREGYG